MNIERLLVNKISELIRDIEYPWLEDNLLTFSIAPFSQINIRDTLDPSGNKCLFCFARSTTNQKQKWGFYVRIYNWRSILWRL